MNTTERDRTATIDLYTLRHIHDHLKQYLRYAEEMRAIGRGMTPSSPFSPEMLIAIVADAIKGAR
jgi:hypothetical protein